MRRLQNTLLLAIPLTGLCLALSGARPSEAKPPFAAKEGKPCAYCHVGPAGGARNYRGLYYKAHELTFAEFDDAAEAKKAGVEVGPDPDPATKPKSWTAPKTEETAAPVETSEEKKPEEAKPETTEKKVTLAQAKAKATTAEKAYNAKKKDPAAKKAYAASLADLARVTMTEESLPARQRYPEALRLLRKALSLDPKNKQAMADKQMIEDVYKKMGRPIPK